MLQQLLKVARTWWGRSLVGAILGGLLVSFANISDPVPFLIGMLLGAIALYFLGQWE